MAKFDNIRTKLLRDHSVDDYGIWNIFGEDPNCDFGGSHHTPFIETVEGRYEHVVEYALSLPNFFTWGGGGHIEQQEKHGNIKVIGKMRAEEILELRKKRGELQKEIETIDQMLKGV
jgi:hypothetical protein